MKTLKIYDDGEEVFSSDLDKVSAQTLENHKKAEAKREIRHGDLAIWRAATEPRLVVRSGGRLDATFEGGRIYQKNIDRCPENYVWLDINIFDLLKEAMKGEKIYSIQGVQIELAGYYIRIGSTFFEPESFFKAIFSLYVHSKLAEAKK